MNSLNSLTSAVDPTAAVYLVPYVDMIFNGTGSGTIAIGRPRIWRKAAGRLS